MATDLVDLQESLNIATGQTLDELQREALLVAGTALFNADSLTPITLIGTAADRTLTALEQRLMVLYAVLAYMDGEILKAAMNAIIHRNDAGRTDLSQIPLRLGQARKDLYDTQIKPLLEASKTGSTMEEAAAIELGETLAFTKPPYTYLPTPWPWW